MLNELSNWIVNAIFRLEKGSAFAESLNFFIYDSLKILILLFIMITVVGFFRTFISNTKLREYLKGKKLGIGNFLASIFGAITPFCSCSSIPIFLSMIRAGIPLGVTFSFLITSPLINEYLVIIMIGFFGWKITVAYVIIGIALGFFCGLILGNMGLDKYIIKDMKYNSKKIENKKIDWNFKKRFIFGIKEAAGIIKKIWLWVLFGVGIGAIIHNYVPQEFIHSLISKTGIFSVPIATIIGVPLYGSCAAIVPVAVVLFNKGIPLGTALAFMMAVSALSLPEAIILRRAMKPKLIFIYFAIVTVGIILIGYLLNFLQSFLVN